MEALFGKTLSEIEVIVTSLSLPRYIANQLTDWLYRKHVQSWDEMTNISKKTLALLSSKYDLGVTPYSFVQDSVDGTRKYLYKYGGNYAIESVYIPDKDRATLCVSSQSGCKMNCLFCMTGKQGFQHSLTSGEIVNQVNSLPERNKLTNLVYMGMGEPLDNIDEVLKSLSIFTSPWGFGYSPTRITVSSVGVLPGLERFLNESNCHLAISLHAPGSELRQSLMPVEKAWPIKEVIKLIRAYDWRHQRRVSFEYIMFQGVNDTLNHAKALAEMLHGLTCRVNLIKFHAIPNSPLIGCKRNAMEFFRDALNDRGIITTIRQSRGEDIMAACGMLSTEKRKQPNNL